MAGSVRSVDYLVLNVLHRTNEDWYLELPLAIDASLLLGARVVSVLKGGGRTIVLECSIQGTTIIQKLDRLGFEGKEGQLTGDVLLTLSGDRDMVTHLINLDLKKGISPNG